VPRRPYDSALRREQASATRQRVIQAAAVEFSRNGYGGTSIARIAAAAGVSSETVRTIGPKRVLLEEAAVLVTFGADAPPIDDIDDAGRRYGVDVDDPDRWVSAISELVARLNSDAAGLFRAWASAAADDPEVAVSWAAQQRTVRDGWRAIVVWLDGKGWITSPADREDLATTVWLLTLADTYTRIAASGDDDVQYRRWLDASLRQLLFPAAESRG
jgi:AcrR family transcriptional regulator